MPLFTTIVDTVLTARSILLFLRLFDMDTVIEFVGTTVASDTLPCIASEKDTVDTSSAVIPSNTCKRDTV